MGVSRHVPDQGAYPDEISREPLVPEDGYIFLPKKHGLGLEIDEEKMKNLVL